MLRRSLAIAAALLPLAALGPARAQFPDPWTALGTSGHAGMTCREFSALPASQRGDLVRRMNVSAPQASLAGGTTNDTVDANGNAVPTHADRSTVPGTPLTAGELLSDCQRVSPETSLRDAFSFSNSGQNNQLTAH